MSLKYYSRLFIKTQSGLFDLYFMELKALKIKHQYNTFKTNNYCCCAKLDSEYRYHIIASEFKESP